MSIDLGILGIVLTIISPGLFQFESLIFSNIDPKDVRQLLELRVEKTLDKLASRVFQEMDDDVVRSAFSLKAKDTLTKESLVQKRHSVSRDVAEKFWAEISALKRINYNLDSWSRWFSHGRFVASVCSFVYFLLFLLLAVLDFTNLLPAIIRDFYYWIAFFVLIVPLMYVFVCWLMASYWKRNYEHLSEK